MWKLLSAWILGEGCREIWRDVRSVGRGFREEGLGRLLVVDESARYLPDERQLVPLHRHRQLQNTRLFKRKEGGNLPVEGVGVVVCAQGEGGHEGEVGEEEEPGQEAGPGEEEVED